MMGTLATADQMILKHQAAVQGLETRLALMQPLGYQAAEMLPFRAVADQKQAVNPEVAK